MEKKVILVGEPNRTEAVRFMDNIMAKLRYEYKVDVVYINYGGPLFRTNHTEVRFIFDSIRQSEYIQGIRADAIFGIQYPCMMGRVTSDTFMAEKTHMGLDEYIYKIEKEAKKVWITTAGSYDSELYKRLVNSVYGANANRSMMPKMEIFIGARGNGKSQAVYEYMKQKLEDLTVFETIKFDKGENNMPTHTIQNPECVEYCRKDVENTTTFAKALQEFWRRQARKDIFTIKKVYFNDPVTVVIWEDGTKTVVRCNNDQYDPEKGLAMAIAKKALGTNKSGSNYYDTFKKWLPKTEETEEE